jgi:peptidyl-prolyl cis-trans isomerase SurA
MRALAGTLLFCATLSTTAAQTLDRVVAVVVNDAILESELKAQIQFFALNNRLDQNSPGVRDQVLQSLINEKLIVAKAIEDSVTVSDEEVQQQLDRVVQQRIQQAGSEARLEEAYGMPLSRIKREFRDEMRKNLLAQKLQQQRFGATQIGRIDVEEFYKTYKDSLPRVQEEVELAHIFLRPRPGGPAKAASLARIKALRDSLVAGADFADLARRYSADPGSAPQGGDLGLVRRGQFVKEFESAVFGLTEKQLSEVVETDFGYHLIQLLERRGDAVRARHILLRIDRSADADSVAIARLDSMRTALLAGANFAEMAKRFSENKETNLIGGVLGTFEVEQLDKSLYAAVSGLQAGEISRPARLEQGSSYGYHIVLVKRRTPPHTMTLDGDFHRIEAIALNFKRSRDYQTWLDELRSKIYWAVRP